MTPQLLNERLRQNQESLSGLRSVREVCEAAGLNYASVRKQMSRGGFTPTVAEAITQALEVNRGC